MIEIKHLNKNDLLDFIKSEEFSTLNFIPISKNRAISHCENPRLNQNDVLLFLAYEDKNLVGYLGALPDQIFINDSFQKCTWLSCLWIDPQQRGKKIAQKLLDSCFQVWENRILVTEFTDSAKYLYDKSGIFNSLSEKRGVRLYFRSDLEKLLPPKKEFFNKIKPLLKVSDNFFNLFIDFKNSFVRNKLNSTLKIVRVSEIDDELIDFIKSKQEKQLFKRGKEELNWILKFPWIVSSPQTSESKKYHFSSVDKSFEFIALKLYNKTNELRAFVMFSKRNQSLKLPYCYFENENLPDIMDVINYYIQELKVSTFTCFNYEIAIFLNENKTKAFHKKEIKRNYIISKVFGETVLEQKFEIQDGDADACFT
ncbi:MAG: GNAT family N-acetyltransferase [Bacteroidota bacterium]